VIKNILPDIVIVFFTEEDPSLFCAVSSTVYLPGWLYLFVGSSSLAMLPSPNSQ